MRQEINLYRPELRRRRQPLAVRHMLNAFAVFVVSLGLIQLSLWWNQGKLRHTLTELKAQQQVLQQQVVQLRARRPQSQSALLAGRIDQLKRKLERSRRISGVIGDQLGNTTGFSGYLQSMARQSPDNIALTEFRFFSGGEYVELAGWTRQAATVPQFIQQLRRENSFEKVKFGVMSIEQDENQKNLLYFSLGRAATDSASLSDKVKAGSTKILTNAKSAVESSR
ncbi:MAG: PilN domain-containing protein [Exilibacterium sp.]